MAASTAPEATPQYEGHVVVTRGDETWDCPIPYLDEAKEQGWKPVDPKAAKAATDPKPGE